MNSEFSPINIETLANMVWSAKTPLQLAAVERILQNAPLGKRLIVAMPLSDNTTDLHHYEFPRYFDHPNIVPYFSNLNLFFLYLESGLVKSHYKVDYTISFDSNAARAVHRIVKGNSLKFLFDHEKDAFHLILSKDLNFDAMFYYLENIGQGYAAYKQMATVGVDDAEAYWSILSDGFKENLVELELFLTVDCKEYVRSGRIVFGITLSQAQKNAQRLAYEFYASEEKRELTAFFAMIQREMMLQLIQTFKTQFTPLLTPEVKLMHLFDFLQNTVGAYFDREAVLAFKYFMDMNSVRLFTAVNKGGKPKDIGKTINNIAWDMMAARLLERWIAASPTGDYTIPFFLSFDKDLCEALREFPIKVAIVGKNGEIHPIPENNSMDYFISMGCSKDSISNFFTAESKQNRGAVATNRTEKGTERLIETGLKELAELLTA